VATPSLAQVRAFVAVADALHFGTAASRLGISQPALSAALASLESLLGVQLVERTTRRVLLTPEGDALLPRARSVAEAVDGLVDAAAGQQALAGRLRIGVIPTVAPYLLPSLIRRIRRDLPDLVPEVREEQTARLIDDLSAARLDVAIIALPAGVAGLHEIPIYDEGFVLVVPTGHRYAGSTNLSPASLGGQNLLLLDEGHCLRDQVLELCRSAAVDGATSSAARTTSLATVVQLVSSGLGTTLLPETALAAESRRGALAVARFTDPAPGRRIGLVYRASSARGAAYAELANVVRQAARRLPVTTLDQP